MAVNKSSCCRRQRRPTPHPQSRSRRRGSATIAPDRRRTRHAVHLVHPQQLLPPLAAHAQEAAGVQGGRGGGAEGGGAGRQGRQLGTGKGGRGVGPGWRHEAGRVGMRASPAHLVLVTLSRMRLEALPAMPTPACASALLRASDALTSTTRKPSSLGDWWARARVRAGGSAGSRSVRVYMCPAYARASEAVCKERAAAPPAPRARARALTWR